MSRSTHAIRRRLAFTLPFLALTSIASALQSGPGGTGTTVPPTVGGAPFIEAWVDPCRGDDLQGQVGCPDRPFSTLNQAISAVSAMGPSPAAPGLVHANPGVYSQATNNEFLPVQMQAYVNVQGAGAKRTVIRGSGEPNSFIFMPAGGDACECGVRDQNLEVLVELGSIFAGGYDEMFDGFTLQGGDVQMHIEGESTGDVTISNCVFDMLDMSPDVGVPGPTFGIEMVHTYDPGFPDGYLDLPLKILNNTFIMGWAVFEGVNITSLPDAVAIVDVNDPLCGFPFPDPDPQLRGVGNPNIQNNLIRYACEDLRTPMIGIDASDTAALIAGVPTPSNAFDPNLPGGFDLTTTWCSAIQGAFPVPAVNPQPATGGQDPAFVGEMLTNFAGAIFPFTVGRDWRILPDSNLVDRGVAPQGGVLVAANGTTYVDGSLPESSFDFDGEHYGNLRIEGGLPDIGFDETSLMINCGGYGNDTRSYGQPNPLGCPGIPGLLTRVIITPGPGTLTLCEDLSPEGAFTGFACPGGFSEAFSAQFGSLVPPLALGLNQFQWIQTAPLAPLSFVCFVQNDPVGQIAGYVPPCDGTAHSFGFTLAPGSPITDAGLYRTEQGLFTPTGGAPLLTNMQASYD